MDLPIQSIESLRAEGRARGQVGAPASTNPFPAGTEHHRQWDLGHIDGELSPALYPRVAHNWWEAEVARVFGLPVIMLLGKR